MKSRQFRAIASAAAICLCISCVRAFAGTDVTPPVFSGISVSAVTYKSAIVSWTTSEAADTQVEYGPTTAYGLSTALKTARVTSHFQALDGLKAKTWYYYRVKSRDAAGNQGISGRGSFTTFPASDVTPPAITEILPAVDTSGKVNVTANISDAAGIMPGSAKVYYAAPPATGCNGPVRWLPAAMSPTSGSGYKATLPGVFNSGDSLCLKVGAQDAGANENAASSLYTANPYKVSFTVVNFQSTTILNSGKTGEKVDMVFLGDGYTFSELGTYRDDVKEFTDHLFSQPPFSDYKGFFNVHRVDVVSSQSGTDNPNCNGVNVDTALDSGFSSTGSDCRVLFTHASAKVAEAAAHAPAADTVVVLVNTSLRGGAAILGRYGVFSRVNSDTMAHELGHSFGLLADEYDYGGPETYANGEPSEPNITINTARSMLKWGQWVTAETALPTTITATTALDTPGLYEGAKYSKRGVYRPTNASKMRILDVPFERINYGLLVDRIFDYVPEDKTAPLGSLTCGQPVSGKMSVTLSASDPESYVMAYRLSASPSFSDTAWQLASNKADFTLNQPAWPAPAKTGAQIYAQFRNGYGAAATVSCLPSSAVNTISAGMTAVIPVTLQNRSVIVNITPNSFSEPVTVTVRAPGFLPQSADQNDRFKSTGMGMEITLDKPVQPAENVTIDVIYTDADVEGLNEADLVLARYDETAKNWLPMESVAYPELNKVSGKTRHFSLFQVMSMRPLAGLAQARIYPNPFYPARGQASVKFDGLPAGASVKIYTLQGELVWKGAADSVGLNGWQTEWRGVNRSGRAVASGLYLVYFESGGAKKTMKVSVVK